jgi:hypothetical protein
MTWAAPALRTVRPWISPLKVIHENVHQRSERAARNRMSNAGDEPALATRNHLGLNKQLQPSLDHDHDRRRNGNDSEAACARGMQAPDQEKTRSRFRWARGHQP